MEKTPDQLRAFLQASALITEVQANILGMYAENEQRRAVGSSMAYRDDDFLAQGNRLSGEEFAAILRNLG